MATYMLLLSLAVGLQASPPGTTPRNVKGDTTPNGITVTAPNDGFTIEIAGKRFKALSSDRLLWSVDAMTIELVVASPSPLLPDSATDAAILRDYRRAIAGADDETFTTSRGLAGVLWANTDRSVIAAVVIGRRIVVLSATPSTGGTVAQAREYLKSAMSTLRPIASTDTRANTRREPDVASSGMTLQGQLKVQSALFGKAHVGLLSGKLATETDKRVQGAVVIDHNALVEIARLLPAIGEDGFTVSIFDGRQAHAINIESYDFKTETFVYWDPWGKGSFLERENNAAGVAARPHPNKTRFWLLSFDEMARILYSMVLPMEKVIGVFRLITLAAGPAEQIVATYRALHAATPDLEELAPERLELDAKYLMAAGKPDAATAIVAARLALHPSAPTVGLTIDQPRVRALAASSAPRRQRKPQFLEPAKRHDFFTFFHLEQTGVEGSVTRFRPTSEKFRPLVEVVMTTTADGAITSRQLSLDRAFIADPALTAFAQDIANSFLSFSVDTSEASELKGLSNELWQRERPLVPIPGARVPGTTILALPSPAYMTYLGQHPSLELVLPASIITLRNVSKSSGRDLVITVVNR